MSSLAPAHVLVLTDIMFKQLKAGSLPKQLLLLVDYDLPLKKASCFAISSSMYAAVAVRVDE